MSRFSSYRARRVRRCHLLVEALEHRDVPSTFLVANNHDHGAGSLRQAILNANATPGLDTIDFNIGPNNVIQLNSLLPTITNPVVIDGTTDPGYAANGNGFPYVVVDGANVTSGTQSTLNGLTITASGCTVRGLALAGWLNDGIQISGSSNDTIQDNVLGATSSVAGNAEGIELFSCSNVAVGGTTAFTRNYIAGNKGYGITLNGTAGTQNLVYGNYIGVVPGLTIGSYVAAPNGADGIAVFGSNNVIGGLLPSLGNYIDANPGFGISINGANATSNDVLNNYLGLSPDGKNGLGNSKGGVEVLGGATSNLVNNNRIIDNNGPGVLIQGTGTQNNSVAGDSIGFLGSHNLPAGNFGDGVLIDGGAQHNVVGDPNNPTVISANQTYGVAIADAGTEFNQVEATYLGTDPTGANGLANGGGGVLITNGASNNTIGGGNVISANRGDGVDITGAKTSNNFVVGNLIGTNAGDTAGLANSGDGVLIGSGASANTIGGNVAGSGNVLSGNGQDGVEIGGAGTQGNQVLGNEIGTNAAGSAALGNGYAGVNVDGGASNNDIGVVAVNLISGNDYGVVLSDAGTTGNQVAGNRIGTNLAGTAALANQANGVLIKLGAAGNSIGGTGTSGGGTGNLISGNGASGILLSDANTAQNLLQGNLIGVNAADSAALSNGRDGVEIISGASNNTVGGNGSAAGNVISGNSGNGIAIAAANGETVAGNQVGTNQAGTVALPNAGNGIAIEGANGNTIGGTGTGAGNILSGNAQTGVAIIKGSSGNTIAGNLIGLAAGGTTALPNGTAGVAINSGASKNTIGGTTAATQNTIDGNGGDGVRIEGTGTNANLVESDFIGGAGSLANGGNGVLILAGAGDNSVTFNTISGNGGAGVQFYGAGTTGNVATRDHLGTTPDGHAALADLYAGVAFQGGATGNSVTDSLISGNTYGVIFSDAGTIGNTLQNNRIGTDITGLAPLPNLTAGIVIKAAASNNLIGGTTAGTGNFISGNGIEGILITDAGTAGNTVERNYIGTGLDGAKPVPNGAGIVLQQGASNNLIGDSGAGNLIANNNGPGVHVTDNNSTGNTISQNSIFANNGFGILLGSSFYNNTPGGPHVGPNDLQNYPILSVGATPGVINGTINSTPNTAMTIEFFGDPSNDLVLAGQGKDYVGSVNVTTDAAGNASFTFHYTPTVDDPYLVATATDAAGNTSMFTLALNVALSATGLALTGTPGVAFAGTVATFTGTDAPVLPGIYSASIQWGDGQTSSGTIVPGANNTYSITGSHTYTNEALLMPITVTIRADGGNTIIHAYSTISLVYGMTGIAKTVPFVEGSPSQQPYQIADGAVSQASISSSAKSFPAPQLGDPIAASFLDADPHAFAGLYTATINWGDAAANAPADTSSGTIVADGSGFDVGGTHVYARAGTYPITVTVQDAFGASVTINSTAQVSLQPLSLSGESIAVTANTTFTGVVATLTDPDPRTDPTFYTATVTWDDGTTSPGTVSGSGPFTITASHPFGTFNNTAIETVTVTDKLGRTATITDRVVDPPAPAPVAASAARTVPAPSADPPIVLPLHTRRITTAHGSNTAVSLTVHRTRLMTHGHGTMVTIEGTYHADTNEPHRARIRWGDGSTTSANLGDHKEGTFTIRHTFQELKHGTVATMMLLDSWGALRQSIQVKPASLG